MSSQIKNQLVILSISASVLLLVLLNPYTIANSHNWAIEKENFMSSSGYDFENIDIYEFTGDALPTLEDTISHNN
jgi:hypothetical protein